MEKSTTTQLYFAAIIETWNAKYETLFTNETENSFKT